MVSAMLISNKHLLRNAARPSAQATEKRNASGASRYGAALSSPGALALNLILRHCCVWEAQIVLGGLHSSKSDLMGQS